MICPTCETTELQTIGENTSGYILWCNYCGTIVDENSQETEIPLHFKDNLDT